MRPVPRRLLFSPNGKKRRGDCEFRTRVGVSRGGSAFRGKFSRGAIVRALQFQGRDARGLLPFGLQYNGRVGRFPARARPHENVFAPLDLGTRSFAPAKRRGKEAVAPGGAKKRPPIAQCHRFVKLPFRGTRP